MHKQNKMQQADIIVVGGGAAGLMAAGQAAEAGARVLVLEKMKRPGRKICISGKGRCNLTNTADLTDFIAHFGKKGRFLRQAFHRFFSDELIAFFTAQGLPVVTERGGRVFPASGKAPDVLKIMQEWLDDSAVTVQASCPVTSLLVEDGHIAGVQCGRKKIAATKVILATGGASYPATGSNGEGYALAEAVGHRVVDVRPALVPLITKGNVAGRMRDLQLRNVALTLFVDGKKKGEAFGELTFMPYGLSGPIVLTLSGAVVDCLNSGTQVELSLDLKPALDAKKLDLRLQRDFSTRFKEPLDSILRGLLPKEMIDVALEMTHLSGDRLGGEIQRDERKRLRNWLKDFRFKVTGYRPIAEAIVTAGGVDTREVDPRTMESRLINGLYIVGELLDIQGDTGGYNLQAAFSTGWLAGRAAALAGGQ